MRWARLRESLPTLVPAPWQRRALLPARVSGLGRIRTASIRPAAVREAVQRLEQLLGEHPLRAAPQAGPLPAGLAGADTSDPGLPEGLPAPEGSG